MNIDQSKIPEIGEIVVDAAMQIFEKAGVIDDFCIQHVSSNAIFGGTNRLIFHADGRWSAVVGLCTERFLSALPSFVGKF